MGYQSVKFPQKIPKFDYQYIVMREFKYVDGSVIAVCMKTNDQDKAVNFYADLTEAGVKAAMYDSSEII